jgi:hypothetical protein
VFPDFIGYLAEVDSLRMRIPATNLRSTTVSATQSDFLLVGAMEDVFERLGLVLLEMGLAT